jgi:predicted lysophospholipase L1 biosynthesis ABC-type transport system permease subunit
MFAHKPLCTHYEHDTIKFKKWYICRSCFLVYFGITAGLIITPFTPELLGQYAIALPVMIGVIAILSYPPLYKKHPRWLRDTLRTALGVSIAGAFTSIIFQSFTIGIISCALLALLWITFGKLRQKTKRFKCETCPEMSISGFCSGYKKQAEAIQNYERAMEQLIKASKGNNDIPSIIIEKSKNK